MEMREFKTRRERGFRDEGVQNEKEKGFGDERV